MRLNCPFCGLRSIEEFTYLGDASVVRPDDNANQDDFYRYVFVRENPKGRQREYWHHSGGCRTWLVVERDTASHEVFSIETAEDATKERS